MRAGCVDSTKGWDAKSINAAWGAYKRSFPANTDENAEECTRTATVGAGLKEKCPLSQALQILGCIQDQSRWFDLWVANGRSWGKAILKERQVREQSEEASKGKAWLTYDQVLKLYKNEVPGGRDLFG